MGILDLFKRKKKGGNDEEQEQAPGKRGGGQEFGSNSELAAALNKPTLGLGDEGEHVAELQQQLVNDGFLSDQSEVDGDFGKRTDAAVRRMQKQLGCDPDGIVGPDTRMAMIEGGVPPKAIIVTEKEEGKWPWQRKSSNGIELEASGFTCPTAKLLGTGMNDAALRTALLAFDTAFARGQTKSTVFTLTDFTKSDDERRLWVFDVKSGEVFHNEFVTHGYGSDGDGYHNLATQFGNVSGSGKSSIGLMKAGKKRQSYAEGRKGSDAMEAHGLEEGFNDNVHERVIIMHEARTKKGIPYVTENGSGGASAGCWALDPAVNAKVISSIPSGSLMFNYFPDKRYLENSQYLKNKVKF